SRNSRRAVRPVAPRIGAANQFCKGFATAMQRYCKADAIEGGHIQAMPTTDLLTRAQDIAPRITALRRAIHAEPELGLDTPLTIAKVRAELADLPLEWRTGESTAGAVAVLRGGRPGPAVLLRGDMDALPMAEETGLPFASTIPGRMHACGHDAHTAMLAGAARLLAARRGDVAGRVRFLFQPGEEGAGGAAVALREGVLDATDGGEPVSWAFAIHQTPTMPSGMVATRGGPLLASADALHVTVRGRGGHASMPHHANDPIPVAC